MESPSEYKSPSLEIHLLGKFEIYVNGHHLRETEIKGRKARSLLKLIAHQRHHQIVRDHAVTILWPDLDASSANTQLYKALHYIRKAFSGYSADAEDWIEITDDLIRLEPPEGLVTDVQQFEKLAKSGLRARRVPDLEEAVSIYKGDFLPMDRYAEWASMPRSHYNQLYLDVLTTISLQYEAQGNLSDAAEILRVALSREPTLETAHCGLMRIFARKGQSTRAFHQYDVCREVLAEELGVGPSPETKKTLDDIREGRFHGFKESESVPSSVSEPSSPIIGRSEECALIERLLNEVVTGNGGGLVVCGEPGIGKTRLIRELIRRARQNDLPFFLGRTGTGNMAYGPFIELFKDILNRQPEIEDLLPVELGRLVPGFSGEGELLPHADKLAAKSYLFAQIHRFFSRLTTEEPAVVILEDLQAADQGSKELLSYLIRHRGRLPILFVASLRKEEGEPVPAYLADLQTESIKICELAPFTYDEHVNLLHRHAASAIIGAETAGHIYQLSEGNPLYALELLQLYATQDQAESPGLVQIRESSFQFPASERIPDSIHHMVRQKLEKLSAPARHLLYIAAIIGRQVPYHILASIWSNGNMDEESGLFNAIEEVIHARLLEEHGLDYSFRHALVQETIYASISEARRQILHKQAAKRLLALSEEADEVLVEQIAWHYLGGKEYLEAAKYLIRAGKRAESAYAHDDAIQRYQEACNVLGKVGNREVKNLKCEVLEKIGDVFRACGRLEKSYDTYEEAIHLAEDISLDNLKLTELYRKMAVVAIFRTEIDRSEKYLEKAFELAGNDLRAQSRLYITKALHLWHLNRLDEAYEVAQKALMQAKQTEARAETSQACEILAMTCLPLGRWEEGLEYEMERQIHGWSPEIVVATDAHLCLWEYHVSGDKPLQRARSFMEQVSDQASKVGDLRCVAVCHYALGTMHLWRGDRNQAVKELASSLELHERVGSPAGMAYSLARKSVLHTLMGAKELGWQAVQDGLSYAKYAAVRDHCLQRLYGVGIWNRLEAADLEEAAKLVEKSEKLLAESGACGACALELYPWLSYYFLHTKQFDKVRECSHAVSELAEKTGNPIGKAISSVIQSSLCITEERKKDAKEYNQKAWQILNETVPDTGYSPVAYYLERMTEQQAELV